MFGTIYAETGSQDLSPSTREKIGSVNKDKDYVKQGFFGRGWIQLTFRDKYEKAGRVLSLNLLENPDLAALPDHSYEILYRGMTEGWIEVYRTSPNGAVARVVPIKLSDFVGPTTVDYDLARAVINANCKKDASKKCSPPNIKIHDDLYIPPPQSLDAGPKAAQAAFKMERLLCGATKQ